MILYPVLSSHPHICLSRRKIVVPMDIEQEELQFLGFIGIIKESFKIIYSWRKIFSQITLALILPLTFVFLAHIEFSDFVFFKILRNEEKLDRTRTGTPSYEKLTDVISSEWIVFWLLKVAYFTFLLIFSLLSTSAVVYAVACVYTAKPVTFRRVLSVVPKVWKRLMVTFIWIFIIVFCYNVIAIGVFTLWVFSIGNTKFGIVLLPFLLVIYLIGFVYLSVVWHLASVVSVLEDMYGIQAMVKSKNLIKGKMGVAVAIFLVLNVCFFVIQMAFENLVVLGFPMSGPSRFLLAIVFFLLLFKLILFGLVIQTVIYFVCKSYHHENIDKSSLSDHLEVYLGEYMPLKSKDVQMEQLEV